jgi:hypothetical protein
MSQMQSVSIRISERRDARRSALPVLRSAESGAQSHGVDRAVIVQALDLQRGGVWRFFRHRICKTAMGENGGVEPSFPCRSLDHRST